MFRSKTRPVPSPATLRFLYQLAYIGSGTVAGLATLCAEERRRRTAYVQKIANNARRIRQSPRYRQHSAAVALHDLEQQVQQEESSQYVRMDPPDRAVRAPELPSAVESGYEQVANRACAEGEPEPTLNADTSPGPLKRKASGRRPIRPVQSSPPSIDEITNDIKKFLRKVSRTRKGDEAATNDQQEACKTLLRRAASTGAFDAFRSLIRWRTALGPIQEHDMRLICEDSLTFASRKSSQMACLDLYQELVESPQLRVCSVHLQAWLHVHVASAVLRWDTEGQVYFSWAKRLFKDHITDEVEEELGDHCAILSTRGDIAHAGALLRLVSRRDRPMMKLRDDLIQTALLRGDIHNAMKLFQQKLKLWSPDKLSHRDPVLMEQIERLALEGSYRNRHAQLEKLIRLLSPGFSWLSDLSVPARTELAKACLTADPMSNELFDVLCEAVPEASRRRTLSAGLSLRMRNTWDLTRDLDTVWTQYELATRLQVEFPHRLVLGPIEMAVIDICHLAGQPDRAMNLLTSLASTLQVSDLLSLTALTLATKADWAKLEQVLQLAARSKAFHTSPIISQRLDAVIRLYSRRHDSSASWAFTVWLVDHLNYVPTPKTTNALLLTFVANQDLDLIPDWLSYVSTLGCVSHFGPGQVKQLLNRYWRDHRPSHVSMMQLCRDLVKSAPLLDKADFESVLKSALAYDIRVGNTDAGGPQTMRALALSNLSRVNNLGLPAMMPKSDREILRKMTRQAEPLYTEFGGSHQRLVQSMILSMSQKRYQDVVDMYWDNMESSGLPVSQIAFQLAVEARLHLDRSDPTNAQQMIDQARDAGFNVIGGMGVMLVHEMKWLVYEKKSDAHTLQSKVTDHYRINEGKGQDPHQHVGITAADVLLRSGAAVSSLGLLNSLTKSQSIKGNSAHLVAMTVYLKVCGALGMEDGIKWAVRNVLAQNVRLNQEFLDTLATVLRKLGTRSDQKVGDQGHPTGTSDPGCNLREAHSICRQRYYKQIKETKLFGKRLVQVLAQCVNEHQEKLIKRRELGARPLPLPWTPTAPRESDGLVRRIKPHDWQDRKWPVQVNERVSRNEPPDALPTLPLATDARAPKPGNGMETTQIPTTSDEARKRRDTDLAKDSSAAPQPRSRASGKGQPWANQRMSYRVGHLEPRNMGKHEHIEIA